MITILVDTREQKTPALIDQYQHDHKLICKDLTFFQTGLKIGDLFGNNQLIEIKWGADLYQSLNSEHLKDQMIRMKAFALEKGCICHLVLANHECYLLDLHTFKRAVSLAQQYGIWVHHRNTIAEGLDCAISLIRFPPQPLDLQLPVRNTKKSPFLIRVLSQIDGVSVEFAEFALRESDRVLIDIMDNGSKYWQQKTVEYYKKEMSTLVDKILEALG